MAARKPAAAVGRHSQTLACKVRAEIVVVVVVVVVVAAVVGGDTVPKIWKGSRPREQH